MRYSSLSAEDLVQLCAEAGNGEAWEEFLRRFQKLIGCIVRRVANRWGETSKAIIDELIQDTLLKICTDNCRMLRDFQSHHPNAFFGMLKVTAANVAYDYFRARDSAKRGSGVADCDLSEMEPYVGDSHSAVAKMEREIVMGEIDRILISIDSPTASRDRQIFWLYYRHGFTAKAIGAIKSFGLNVKTVESIIHRLNQIVRQRLAEKEPEPADHHEPEGVSRENPLNRREEDR